MTKKKRKVSAKQKAAARRNIKKALAARWGKPRKKSKTKTKVITMKKRHRKSSRKSRSRGRSHSRSSGMSMTTKALLIAGGAALAPPIVNAAEQGKLPDARQFVDDVLNRGKELLGNLTNKKYLIPAAVGIGLMTQKIPKVKKSTAAAIGLGVVGATMGLAATNPGGARPPRSSGGNPGYRGGDIRINQIDRRR